MNPKSERGSTPQLKIDELLRQAEDLRALIARVRHGVVAGSVGVDQTRLEEWERWAKGEADRLDPILSGQVMTHLAPPEE